MELVNVTNDLRDWLTRNDPTGEYNSYWEEVDTELRQYQEIREDCTNTRRIDHHKAAERIHNQSATPPDINYPGIRGSCRNL